MVLVSCDDSSTGAGASNNQPGNNGAVNNTSGNNGAVNNTSGNNGAVNNTSGNNGGATNNQPGDAGVDGWDPSDDGGPVVVADGGVVVEDEDRTFTCFPTMCDGHLLECGDCEDNDGDGRTDWRDPECLGPCDNTEGPGLSSGVGGVNRANCGVDCYFDFGNGPGNDDCHWDHRCDALEPEAPNCEYDEDRLGGRDCPLEQSEQCTDFCLPYTPNGCDCFGCCTFPELETSGPGGTPAHVWIGNLDEDNVSTCTFDTFLDEEKCPRCTPVEGCNNECGRCEICVGKTEVPDDCFESENNGGDDVGTPDGGGSDNPDQCPEAQQPCGQEGQDECERTYYCITGCCQHVE
jgi:hypothetical protein